jgi:hypothetical protein
LINDAGKSFWQAWMFAALAVRAGNGVSRKLVVARILALRVFPLE